jgi:hypothetical protein
MESYDPYPRLEMNLALTEDNSSRREPGSHGTVMEKVPPRKGIFGQYLADLLRIRITIVDMER